MTDESLPIPELTPDPRTEPGPTPKSGPTLPPSFSTGAALPITKPGYLVELGFNPVLRFSTRGDQTFGGQLYVGSMIAQYDVGSKRLTLLNPDNAISAIVLAEGVADRYARVWQFYGDAANTNATMVVFDGFIDGAPVISAAKVTLSLYNESAGALFSPRFRINYQNGFRVLPVPGLKLEWNDATFILEPERSS